MDLDPALPDSAGPVSAELHHHRNVRVLTIPELRRTERDQLEWVPVWITYGLRLDQPGHIVRQQLVFPFRYHFRENHDPARKQGRRLDPFIERPQTVFLEVLPEPAQFRRSLDLTSVAVEAANPSAGIGKQATGSLLRHVGRTRLRKRDAR